MKLSEKWLREWVNPPLETRALADQFTMAGFEVESLQDCSAGLAGVVVGRVVACAPLPGTDHLQLCKVDAGAGAPAQVLCGAPNVRVGGHYPYAPPGAMLPEGRRIDAAVIRGTALAGMLCSAAELGLGDAADGLLELDDSARPGTNFVVALGLDDVVLEIALTPNRGDCMSVAGLARECGVLNATEVCRPVLLPVPAASGRKRGARLALPAACPRYVGRVIDDVDVTRPAPLWLRERLRRAGVRSISAPVDIANYVMLELGQPMHAFDDAKLDGDIEVRCARAGEKLVFLDGVERELAPDMLVIADAGGPVAMAGVMGGLPTSISATTRSIFLEAAFFAPGAVMGRARRLGLQTDAGQRFERGVNPDLTAEALERATALLIECCGGQPGPTVDTRAQTALPQPRDIHLRRARVTRLIGTEIPAARVEEILRRLELIPVAEGGGWRVQVPAFRFDLTLEADLIEEVARIHGYVNVPSHRLGGRVGMHQGGPDPRLRDWRRVLVERGYLEAITYSFTDPALQERVLGPGESLALQNPIASDMAVMRRGLLPGLLGALAFNRKRQQERVRLFEVGRGYQLEKGDIRQPLLLAGVACGNIYPEQWDIKSKSSDFFDMKSDVEALLAAVGMRAGPRWQAAARPGLHPGQCAEIIFDNQAVAIVSSVHPAILQVLDLEGPVLFFELDADRLPRRPTPQYNVVSRFPSVRRDIAVVVDRGLPVQAVMDVAIAAAGEVLTNLELFDVYQGEGIDLGKKSLALGLTFQASSSTLTDEAVEAVMQSVLNALREKLGGTLRE